MDRDVEHRVRNLKNMDDETWEMAKAAAARNDETLGAWLSRAAHQLAQRERGERVIPPGQPVPPAAPLASPPAAKWDTQPPVDWHGIGAVLAALTAAGIPVQRRVGRRVNALLFAQLGAEPAPEARGPDMPPLVRLG